MESSRSELMKLLNDLNDIGIALSAEKDHERLLEMILKSAMQITHADGGTLYIRTEDNRLRFEIMHTHSLDIHMGGTTEEPIGFYPVSLYHKEGTPNLNNVAACAVLERKTINTPDAYDEEEFDFSGTRNFDKKTGYRSKSFLTVPMVNHENNIIGVLQLINAQDADTGEVVPFSEVSQRLVESLASQAAVTITNRSLIDAQKNLFDALIKLIANAIDEKSPYTAGHCRRVPVLTNYLAEAACRVDYGPLASFNMTEDEKYELDVAAWLHDCGKITTPEYVIDKGTKLETIFDRIELIDTRFEILKRDILIETLKQQLDSLGHTPVQDNGVQEKLRRLDQDKDFIRECNIGGESITEEAIKQVDSIGEYRWQEINGEEMPFLSEEEKQNLKIGRGTLSYREREIINNHVTVTIKMLESLPYPRHLRRVPEYAGGHHEKIDGSGYPNQLRREEMSIPARMLAIADVFEALTARDRPYKEAMPLSKALSILGQMKLDNHIDPDLFDVFIWEKLYLKYANEYLEPEQLDAVIPENLPGYRPPPVNDS